MVSAGSERKRLFERYRTRIRTNGDLNRRLVSFQANRGVRGFGWLKYREAFSAALADDIIERYTGAGDVVLDPFAGIGTTVFAARRLGRAGLGIELLPVGIFAMEARLAAETVDPAVFERHVREATAIDWPPRHDPGHALRHIPITSGAFPPQTERALAGYRAYCETRVPDARVRRLFHLAALDVLEAVSYTRKDGQYLRWDCRARRPGLRSRFRKPRIEPFGDAVGRRLERLAADLRREASGLPDLDLRQGSCLDLLPELPGACVDLVLTSPPYCNRYDYTRTYALELVYLGLDDDDVKTLRQAMLSCTVENATKLDLLRAAYLGRNDTVAMAQVIEVFQVQAALQEVLWLLDAEAKRGALNNANIPRMVRNYFLEMCVVIRELSRVLRPGGRVVMVNDNVRYAGEEIPVDLILSDLAAGLGLRVEHIWTLPRGKGNSSQQMGAHGRHELRKCVYVWKKNK